MDIGVIRRDGRSDAFFTAAARDRLLLRRCPPCERWYGPDASSCPGCGTEDLAWAEATGRATLVSWAITHPRRARDRAEPAAEALLGLVELAEGPWLYGRLAGVARTALRVGLPLAVAFEHPGEGESHPVFRPAGSSAPGGHTGPGGPPAPAEPGGAGPAGPVSGTGRSGGRDRP